MKQFLVITFLFLFSSIPITAQIIHVPGDQPTIQAGIMAAVPGDVVLVAEGTYYENINFIGKAITVASHYYLDGKKKHIKKTIIDGSQPADPDFGSAVSFTSGEDTNSVLCGFTITGGTGTYEEIPPFVLREGGGVYCSASGAKIIHNIISNNKSDNGLLGLSWGGGFASTPPFIPTYVILENNVFEKNRVTGSFLSGGGGASFSSSGRIVNNTFIKNTVYAEEGSAAGGGLIIQSWYPPTPPNEVFMSGNIIVHNKALQNETATNWLGGNGGGMSILGSKGEFTNNMIQHNEVNAVNSSFAPGVLFDFPPDEVYFRNNIISHNTFSGAGACFGGGFVVWDGNPTLENNLFEKNKATYGGGGWIGDAFSSAQIINNTIIKNHADLQGGAIYTKNSTATVVNSILWNNHAPEGSEIYIESGTIDVSYSDVKGGWAGTANMDVNPKTISKFYLLHHNSPCIDAGNPDAMYNDPENPWRPGYALFPARKTVRNDMGMYGGPAAVDWHDFLGKTTFDDEELASSTSIPTETKIDNYPNPFNPQTAIQLELPTDGFVSLKIYNVLGQEVATLVSDNLLAGSYKYVWNASDFASGLYIYRLETNGLVRDKKMMLMK